MATLTSNAAGNDITKQASSSVGSPSPDTQSGARSETMRGEPGKGETMTTGGGIAERQASNPAGTDGIIMTSSERTRHEQRVQSER